MRLKYLSVASLKLGAFVAAEAVRLAWQAALVERAQA
ncbi:MAG: hypothetical protein ACI83N_001348 [Hydrogenophaga sp.]|jgi:hypothetical protein